MNWSEHIPLVTLLSVVFFGGILVAQHRGLQKAMTTLVDKTIPRIHERLDGTEKWQNAHDAARAGAAYERSRIRTSAHGVPLPSDDWTPPT